MMRKYTAASETSWAGQVIEKPGFFLSFGVFLFVGVC